MATTPKGNALTTNSPSPASSAVRDRLTEWLTLPLDQRGRLGPTALEELRRLLAETERALTPATPEEFQSSMWKLRTFCRVFGLPMNEIEETMAIYQSKLGDLPAWLLDRAIEDTIGTHRYRVCPLPSDIRAHVEGALTEAKLTITRARWALREEERRA